MYMLLLLLLNIVRIIVEKYFPQVIKRFGDVIITFFV